VRHWGRIGIWGRHEVNCFKTRAQAEEASEKLVSKKCRRGYGVVPGTAIGMMIQLVKTTTCGSFPNQMRKTRRSLRARRLCRVRTGSLCLIPLSGERHRIA